MQWVTARRPRALFEAFAADAVDTLFRTGCLLTGDASEAEDLVQETFLQVARRWRRVAVMDHPVAYARQILINLAVDGARRRSRQQAELQPAGSQPELPDEGAARALRQIDDLAEFRWALARLAPRERTVLVLRYWADLPVAEVAGILGCSEGTVKSTASRGAARLAPGARRPARHPSDQQERDAMITNELETELRSVFLKTADSIVIPDRARQRLLQRNYHPKTGNRKLAAGLAAATIAAAITIPLAAGGGSQLATAGPVIQLASRTFRLPAGYKLTAATTPPCHAVLSFALPASLLPHHGPLAQNLP
jgi:RNA polymerase sigma-70 factor (sigma-E family)